MSKEEITLRNITKYLDENYANIDTKDCRGLTSKEVAEIKAQKELALDILIRFNLHEYTDATLNKGE